MMSKDIPKTFLDYEAVITQAKKESESDSPEFPQSESLCRSIFEEMCNYWLLDNGERILIEHYEAKYVPQKRTKKKKLASDHTGEHVSWTV